MQNSKNVQKWITFVCVSLFSLGAGAVGGIGVAIRQEAEDLFKIVEIVIEGPAEKSGIFVGEEIKGVDGVSVSRKSLEEVVNMIRGKAGTCVMLTLKHESYPNVRNVKVQRYELETAEFVLAECVSP